MLDVLEPYIDVAELDEPAPVVFFDNLPKLGRVAVLALDQRSTRFIEDSFGPYDINDIVLIQRQENVEQPSGWKHVGVQ